MNKNMPTQLRCKTCEKLLAIEDKVTAKFDIKCHRCGSVASFDYLTDKQFIITDKYGTIISMNKTAEKVTGYTLDESIGKKPSIWGKQMTEDFYKNMWSKLIKKEVVSVILRNKSKSGKKYDVSLRISPFLNKSNEIAFFLGEEQVIS